MADRNPEIVTWALQEPHKGWVATRRGAKYAYVGATEEEALANLQRAEEPADLDLDPADIIAAEIASKSGYGIEEHSDDAYDIIDALESAGLRIVSLEPTDGMLMELCRAYDGGDQDSIGPCDRDALRAALAAAPKRGGE